MPSSKKSASKKSAGKGGSQSAVSARDIQRVLREAKPVEDAPTRAAAAGGVSAAAALPDFCKNYRTQIRPILLATIAFLKLVKKNWAETLASVVAFLDVTCSE